MKKFPLRTQLLMLVALIAFARLWCVTHPKEPRPEVAPREVVPIEVVPGVGPGPSEPSPPLEPKR